MSAECEKCGRPNVATTASIQTMTLLQHKYQIGEALRISKFDSGAEQRIEMMVAALNK